MFKSCAFDGDRNRRNAGLNGSATEARYAGTSDESAKCELSWRIVEAAVRQVFRVEIEDINAESRGAAQAAHARQVAMYLAHVACHHTYTEVGRMVNRDRTTVAYACAVVEDERDDPVFDAALDHLERCIRLIGRRLLSDSSDN